MKSLFNFGDFPLHSGGRTNFKIDCDHLTDADLDALAALAASWFRWSYALGIGTGGSRFACVLAAYNTKDENDPRMIVDDVLTTGASMEAERARVKGESFGLVIVARSAPAEWIHALFRFGDERVNEMGDEKPRRQCHLTLDLQADSREDIVRALDDLGFRLLTEGLTQGASGGVTSGYTYAYDEDEAWNHDRYIDAIIDRTAARSMVRDTQ